VPKILIRHNESGAILHSREINDPDLWRVNFAGVDLRGAAMYAIEVVDPPKTENPVLQRWWRRVDISGANFSGANLSGAVFSEETLSFVNFSKANLSEAVFVRSYLLRCRLNGARFTNARLGDTCFSDCPSLHRAIGLDTIAHLGPSSLDLETLRACIGNLPDSFLLGIGYTDNEIVALRGLYERETTFFSCFISYARADSEFANHLRGYLLKSGISCWQDTEDLRGGSHWRGQIYEAIENQDKLVLVCSRSSLTRPAVVEEILEAIDRERESGKQKLFPIRLDDYIFSDEMESLARTKVAHGEWRENWVVYIRSYHIPDFSIWTNAIKFGSEFKRLVEALKKPGRR
jgi:hypothetical protein